MTKETFTLCALLLKCRTAPHRIGPLRQYPSLPHVHLQGLAHEMGGLGSRMNNRLGFRGVVESTKVIDPATLPSRSCRQSTRRPTVKFVLSLAFCDPLHLGTLCRAADRVGFAFASLSDHLVHPQKLKTPYPYTEDGTPRWPPFTDWPDPWVTIGALAAQTERLHFYTSVYVPALRDPFSVAKAIGTASVLSEGRVALGIGTGWMKDEFQLVDREFHNRGKRLNEMIPVLRKLWSGGWVEHHGEFYDFDPLEMSPVPPSEIPIFVGGFSKPAMRRAATLADGWISDLHTLAELEALIDEVRTYRADSERADDAFPIFGSATDAAGVDGYRRLEDIGVSYVVTFPWVFYHGMTDELSQKVDGIARFADEVMSAFE